jgi:hypothetical protein
MLICPADQDLAMPFSARWGGTVEKRNCWEFMECGREPGGEKAAEFGVCPAATETQADGINGGKNGGRACWAIAGSFAGNTAPCPIVTQGEDCLDCTFYKQVVLEEGDDFVTGTEILIRLHILS